MHKDAFVVFVVPCEVLCVNEVKLIDFIKIIWEYWEISVTK